MTCDGQTLQISAYQALFNAIGTTYGGDGTSTFGLPDLRRGAPIHTGAGYALGQSGGATSVALTPAELPAHTHVAYADTQPSTSILTAPNNALYGTNTAVSIYVNNPHPNNIRPMTSALPPFGGSNAHDNMQPFMAVTYIIATAGVAPRGA